jgi:hypothetical protein
LEPTAAQLQAMADLRALAIEVTKEATPSKELVRLLEWDTDADFNVMSALLHTHTGMGLTECERCWRHMEPEQGNRLVRAIFAGL